jgi:hypothetical protein
MNFHRLRQLQLVEGCKATWGLLGKLVTSAFYFNFEFQWISYRDVLRPVEDDRTYLLFHYLHCYTGSEWRSFKEFIGSSIMIRKYAVVTY